MRTTTKPAPESTASLWSAIWSAIWSDYIAALRAGHREKAAELKARMARFDAEVLGV